MKVKAYPIELGDEVYLVFKAVCCREWEIFVGSSWGRCGYCGVKPVPIG